MLNATSTKDYEKIAREKYPDYPVDAVVPMLMVYDGAYKKGFKAGMEAAQKKQNQ